MSMQSESQTDFQLWTQGNHVENLCLCLTGLLSGIYQKYKPVKVKVNRRVV